MVMDNTWLNNDGLYIKFGKTEAVSRVQGGFECTSGPFLSYFWLIDLPTLTQTEEIQNDVLTVAANSMIFSVEAYVVETAATGVAIDVGLIANDRNASNSSFTADPNGLIAASPTAELTVGDYIAWYDNVNIPAAATGSGALLGTTITVPTLLTASATTATAFTAGQVMVRVNVLPNFATGYTQTHVG